MTDAIRIDIDDAGVLAALEQLRARAADLKPALADIGELLAESTKRRFGASTGPDGRRWAQNSQVTILQYLGRYKGSYTKKGALSSKGAARSASKKPLIGETRSLSTQIYYRLTGDGVEVGSPMIYAAVQQFGARAKAFGRAPWGDIPARPFLGLSEQDRADLLDLLADYLADV
jgi:phage virion morphogenesis protein